MEDHPVTPPSAASDRAWVWTLLAASGAHLALVVAPVVFARGQPGSVWLGLAAVGPLCLLWGLASRSAVALLVGVPAGWALPAYALGPTPDDPVAAVAGLASVAAYLPAAAWLLAPRPPLRAATWARLEAEVPEPIERLPAAGAQPRWRVRAPDPVPAVAAALVAVPAVGVACWPALAEAAARGFPGLPNLARVGLAFGGTLIGLAMATDLFRGRLPGRGSWLRVRVLAAVTGVLVGLRLWIGA